MRCPHRLLVCAALCAASIFAAHRPAQALIVTCTNCGSEFTQLANNFELVEQLAQQVRSVEEAVKRFENMVLNTTGLEEQLFGDALGELRQVNEILGRAKSLSIAAADLDRRFAEKFKDFPAYLKQKLGLGDLSEKYTQWSEDTNSSVLTTLQAAQLQSEQIEGTESDLFSQLETQATTAEGRMQALQTANQIALAAARQTQKLRQLMLVNLQLQANFIQTQMDRQTAQDAALKLFLDAEQDTINAKDGKGF